MVDTIVQICIAGKGRFIPFASSFDSNLVAKVAQHILNERKNISLKDRELNRAVQEDTERLERLFNKFEILLSEKGY